MQYTHFNWKKGKRCLQIEFRGKRTDDMGDWESSGTFADVYEADGYFILVNPFNQKPFGVCASKENVEERL
jgi:hypothetical protein